MIDGDALTILAKHPELLENHHSSWILTPHHGEFKRFVNFNQTSELVDQANAFAKKYHVTLVLKVHILLLVMEMKHIVLCQEIKECHLQVWGIHLLELLVAF